MAARYAILVAGEPPQPVIDKKGTFEEMFLDLLREESAEEEWQLYYAFKGQLPSSEELAGLRGLVITGSVADAFGQDEWLLNLRRTVRAAMDQHKQVLGICFGHQLVGLELGGRVGRAGCWELGTREVALSQEARQQLERAESAAWARLLPERLRVHEFHQDQVLEAPPGATLLASSERCPVEMFSVGGHVLCIQGHPEFDSEVVRLLAERHMGRIGEADAALMRQTLEGLPVDADRLQALCRAFLKGSGVPGCGAC